MIAVGSDDSNVTYGGKVQIYEYNEVTRFAFNSFCLFVGYITLIKNKKKKKKTNINISDILKLDLEWLETQLSLSHWLKKYQQ